MVVSPKPLLRALLHDCSSKSMVFSGSVIFREHMWQVSVSFKDESGTTTKKYNKLGIRNTISMCGLQSALAPMDLPYILWDWWGPDPLTHSYCPWMTWGDIYLFSSNCEHPYTSFTKERLPRALAVSFTLFFCLQPHLAHVLWVYLDTRGRPSKGWGMPSYILKLQGPHVPFAIGCCSSGRRIELHPLLQQLMAPPFPGCATLSLLWIQTPRVHSHSLRSLNH